MSALSMGATMAMMEGSVGQTAMLSAEATNVQSKMTQIQMGVSTIQSALSALKASATQVH